MEEDKFTSEDAEKFRAAGEDQIVSDNLYYFGKAENTKSVQEVEEDENAGLDALTKAEKGDLNDLSEGGKEHFIQKATEEGMSSAIEEIETEKEKIKSGDLDSEQLAAKIAEGKLGTDVKETERMGKAIETAKEAIDKRLDQKAMMHKAELERREKNKL
ncbi:hypothetical protein COY62_02360 [bacterium (Candidatus Howlettbacteria) CG_4_10_14_0_8_um_filter_40_9]|nr:MAG: hypothetical protein COY62_02360 [bacterium (Candidatus Howlettbacteria) CG_4_10_14_0_8_um_filter_40_9]